MPERNPRLVAVDDLREAVRQLREFAHRLERDATVLKFDPDAALSDNAANWRRRRVEEYPENLSATWEDQARLTISVTELMRGLNTQARDEWRRLNPVPATGKLAPEATSSPIELDEDGRSEGEIPEQGEPPYVDHVLLGRQVGTGHIQVEPAPTDPALRQIADLQAQLAEVSAQDEESAARLAEIPVAPTADVADAGRPFVVDGFIRQGYVAGECGHAVARSEWAAGYRTCERCSAKDVN